jgi:hypothetical protein
VAGSGDRLVIETYVHVTTGLIVAPVRVGAIYRLELVLNTGYLVSAISRGARDSLLALGHLGHISGRYYRLHDISVSGVALPPLDMRLNAAIARLDIEAIMGLDFLNQFREVRFDTQTRQMTLIF